MGTIKKNIVYSLLPVAFILVVSLQAVAQEIAAIPPQRQTVLQYIIQDRPLLVDLLTKAGLAPVLSGDSPYTLFAPPEESLKAYEKLPHEELRRVLSDHILEGNYQEKDLKDGATIKSLSSASIQIYSKNGDTFVNGVPILDADNTVSNGVVHALGDCVRKF